MANNNCQIDTSEDVRPRKRKANPSNWKRNQCKKLRNTGQEYNSLSKGKRVPGRKIGLSCGQKCRLKCTSKFSFEDREILFANYWALGDLTRQRNFIHRSIRPIKPKYRHAVTTNDINLRCPNNAFYFDKNGESVQVCKMFFMATLNVSDRCIRTVVSKSKQGFLDVEFRGKHLVAKVSDEIKSGIRNHISSIPTVESHYTRANTQRKYINGDKTLVQLYKDYKIDCQENDKPFAKLSMYRHIFNYEFNISFHSPKKDICEICVNYENSNENEKESKKEEYDFHLREKNLSREEKSRDKTKITENFVVACFDLQAALPAPKGDVSTFYYKSRLNCFNFTVCELQQKGLGNVHSYFWHEGEGNRGSNEIGSCLLKFIKDIAERNSSDDCEIVLYSDNCGGQNKNKNIITTYLYAVANYNIKSITHKFLVVGHSQNEGDCVHSIIEKNIKRALKSGPIYLPSQYAVLIASARKTGSPMQMNELSHNDFFDLKIMSQSMTRNIFNIDENKIKFNFNDISIIKVDKDHLDRYFFKTSYTEQDYRSVIIANCKPKRGQRITFGNYVLKPAYSNRLPISKKKYDDLQTLVKKKAIPSCHAHFFEHYLKYDARLDS